MLPRLPRLHSVQPGVQEIVKLSQPPLPKNRKSKRDDGALWAETCGLRTLGKIQRDGLWTWKSELVQAHGYSTSKMHCIIVQTCVLHSMPSEVPSHVVVPVKNQVRSKIRPQHVSFLGCPDLPLHISKEAFYDGTCFLKA